MNRPIIQQKKHFFPSLSRPCPALCFSFIKELSIELYILYWCHFSSSRQSTRRNGKGGPWKDRRRVDFGTIILFFRDKAGGRQQGILVVVLHAVGQLLEDNGNVSPFDTHKICSLKYHLNEFNGYVNQLLFVAPLLPTTDRKVILRICPREEDLVAAALNRKQKWALTGTDRGNCPGRTKTRLKHMFRDIWWEEEEEWWDRDLICDWNVARMKRITMMIFTICWDLTPRFTTRQLVCNVGLIASYCVETVLSSPLPHISHVPSEMKGTGHRRRLYLRVIREEPSTDKGEGIEDRKVDPLKRERERERENVVDLLLPHPRWQYGDYPAHMCNDIYRKCGRIANGFPIPLFRHSSTTHSQTDSLTRFKNGSFINYDSLSNILYSPRPDPLFSTE